MKIDIRLPNLYAHIETANGHRYAIDLHNIDLSHCDLLSAQEKTDTAAAIAAAISGKVIDPYQDPPTPPTALEVWEREATRLDKELVSLGSLARTIEDLATVGAVSQKRKDLLAGTIAARVAHRLVKPA